MGTKTKIALAGTFVGLVAMAAAAFGQTGSGSGSDSGAQTTKYPTQQRRAAAAQNGGEYRCGRHDGRRARRAVHVEAKVKVQSGFANVTIDQGDITVIDHSAKKITIRRLDGKTVSATATDATRVCKDGQPASFDSLKVGDHARLMSIKSERFTGLRRIGAVTPGSEPSQPAGRPADFSGVDLGDLTGEVF